jgi:hypothetical protein
MDYALIMKLSREGVDSRDAVSDMIGARLQWDESWLGRHCRGRSSGACRLVGGREGGASGEVVASAPRVVNCALPRPRGKASAIAVVAAAPSTRPSRSAQNTRETEPRQPASPWSSRPAPSASTGRTRI